MNHGYIQQLQQCLTLVFEKRNTELETSKDIIFQSIYNKYYISLVNNDNLQSYSHIFSNLICKQINQLAIYDINDSETTEERGFNAKKQVESSNWFLIGFLCREVLPD